MKQKSFSAIARFMTLCLTGCLCACGSSADDASVTSHPGSEETEPTMSVVTVTEEQGEIGYDFVQTASFIL